jgi:hypothetical protein
MSKMDDLRAMREARYEAAKSGASKPVPAAKKRSPGPSQAETAEAVPASAQSGQCGHRAISGRTCTREKGHAAKSHRYS